MLLKQVDELREEASSLKMEKARLSAKVGELCSPRCSLVRGVPQQVDTFTSEGCPRTSGHVH